MSVEELRNKLKACEVGAAELAQCVEKSELVELLHAKLEACCNQTCSVCLLEGIQSVRMPCHATPEGSTLVFCRRCIEIICDQSKSKVGRCPSCRKHISIHPTTGEISIAERMGTCRMCCQPNKNIVDFNRQLCDKCLYGTTHVYRYECDRCHQFQKIPHPMWQYQATPEQYGTATWACHMACGDYTHWRIHAEDAERVPDDACPESWGRRDAWLARVRELRRNEMHHRLDEMP